MAKKPADPTNPDYSPAATERLVDAVAATEQAAEMAARGLEPWDGYENIYWQSEQEPDYFVTLRRLEPETWPHPVHGRDVIVKGPLGVLPFKANAEFVKAQHGGGRFQLHAVDKASGKYIKGMVRTLFIPMVPRIVDPNLAPPTPANGAQPAAPAAPPQLNLQTLGDQVLANSPQEWHAYINQALATKKLLEGNDSSGLVPELLKLLVTVMTTQRREADPIAQMIQLMELQERLRDSTPGTGDNPWVGALGKVAEAVGRMAARPAAQLPGRPAARTLPAPAAAAPAEPVAAEGDEMGAGWSDRARECVEQMVTHYLCVPQTPPAETAELLELLAPIPLAMRATALGPWRSKLHTLGKGMVAQDAPEPELVAGWTEYFNQVFDLFTKGGSGEPTA